MADVNKSVLLVDFDSVHRSLTAAGGEAAARLVTRVPGWLKGLQTGRLLGPGERALVTKRCYTDPKALGEGRMSFQLAGFEVVECAATPHGRGVDLMMAMDALEMLHAGEAVDEFVLLSGEPTLAPLITRLKAHEKRTAIYADSHTAQGYRALADRVLEIAAFAEFLLTHDAPDSSAAMSVDRAEIESFARRVHAATNIPLFSPRTFAELFRLLTEEIIENGYHFQTTAKNVADRLSESGRSVTRRQVVFIVKGLALKGHVFSTTDSPRKLAEVFREQAVYLMENAGVKLDEQQERILSAWLVDRVPTSVARPPAPPSPTPTPAPPPAPAAAQRGSASLNGGSRPAVSTETAVAVRPMSAEPLRAQATAKSKERPGAEKAPAPAASEPAPAPPAARAPMISPDDARAAIAAKIAQSVRPKPVPSRTPAAAIAAPPAAPAESEDAEEAPESIENSILAAIAEAVDVLVEDGTETDEKPKKPAPAAKKRAPVPAAASGQRALPEPRGARPRNEPRREEGGEDIGDEIQRIIATYNRNRKEEPPA